MVACFDGLEEGTDGESVEVSFDEDDLTGWNVDFFTRFLFFGIVLVLRLFLTVAAFDLAVLLLIGRVFRIFCSCIRTTLRAATDARPRSVEAGGV